MLIPVPGVPRWCGVMIGVAVAAGLGGSVPEAAAQEVWFGGARGWTNHDLLRHPRGIEAGIEFGIRSRLSIQVGYQSSRNRFESFGSTCVGLVDPELDCDGEGRAERGRVQRFAVAVPIAAYDPEWATILLTPEVYGASVSSLQYGERTGRSRSADQTMVGFGAGAEVRIPLVDHWPLHLRVAGSSGWLLPWRPEAVADGYTPFETTVRVSNLSIGLSFSFR